MGVAPSRVPIFIRPIAKMITSSLAAQVSEPALKSSLSMVDKYALLMVTKRLTSLNRLKPTSRTCPKVLTLREARTSPARTS